MFVGVDACAVAVGLRAVKSLDDGDQHKTET